MFRSTHQNSLRQHQSARLPLLVFVAAAILLLASCGPRDERFGSQVASSNFSSNGERIYHTGTSSSGDPILSSGGGGMMNRHRQMHGGGCALCHGANREGKRLWPQFWIEAPALTPTALFAENHTDHDHAGYDDDSLRLAILTGVTPSGSIMDDSMPRWTMSGKDMADLIAYLKQPVPQD